jgi:glycosyltransferase involved in cell wall biosynthesis
MPRVIRTPAAMFPVGPGPVRRHWPAPFASYRDSLSLSPVALIPAYNEAAVIESVVAATLKQISNVIVVDDGSTDATADLAGAAGAEVIRLPRNRGKAGAVMAGFAAALARGYTAVVMLDADGQHLPGEIPGVLAPVLAGDADLVVGSRFLDVRSEIPRYRVLGQKTLNLFTALGAGVSLTDTQSGFRALGPAAMARLDFVSDGYSLESDMIAHFAACGLRIREVPISCRYDVPNSHKKNPVLHGFEIVRAMSYAIAVRQRRALGVIGVPCVMFGSAMGMTPAILPPSALHLSSPALVGSLLAVGSLFIVGSLWPLVKTRRSSRRASNPSASR